MRFKRILFPLKKIVRRKFRFLAFALAIFSQAACGANNNMNSSASPKIAIEASTEEAVSMKISIKIEDKVVTGTLTDSETTRDFISLLPLTMTTNDLFRREKFASLPRAISTEGKRTHTYEVGDIGYWSPGPDVAIFYRHDGQKIPDPGIIVIGRIDSGVEALNVPGSIKVTVELIK